jgi:hypothetical protein
MTDSGLLPEDTSPTSSYVVDGMSLSPFETLSSPVSADASAASIPAQPAETPAPKPYVPYHPPRRAGPGVIIKLFTLGVKLLPVGLVLVGGYFTYTYYFGPIPIVDKLLHRGTIDAPPPKSKVAVMMDMTKGAVSMNDSRVNFANELAEGEFAADPSTMETTPTESAATPAGFMKQAVASTRGATKPKPARAAGVVVYSDRNEAAPPTADAPARSLTNPEPVILESEVDPSPVFLDWVRRITVTGVRPGPAPMAFVDDVVYGLYEKVDHSMQITLEGVDADRNLLIFRDRTGALLGKRY